MQQTRAPRTLCGVSRERKLRLAALAVLIVGLVVIGKVTGLTDRLAADELRASLQAAGAWGALLFIAAFSVGELIHIPGFVFIAVAIVVYGRVDGAVLSLVGAVVSVIVSFLVVRGVGGRALEEIERPLIKKALEKLDTRPVRTVVILRLIFWMAPPLNYALALSSVRFRDYVAGSIVGLILPVAACSVFFDYLAQWFL